MRDDKRRKTFAWIVVVVGLFGVAVAYSRYFARPLVRNAFWSGTGGLLEYSQARYDTTRQRAAAIIAALDKWKATHGQYPVTLEELVPSELPRVDPPLVGKGVWEYGRLGPDVFELGFFVGPLYESDQYHSGKGAWMMDR
jgi:hypothetical protein